MPTRRSFLATIAVLTGSCAFGVQTRNSDEDWLMDWETAMKKGFLSQEEYFEGDGFTSYREGNLNVIVALNDDFYDRWMKAHRHCLIERPREKKRRIKIFRHYLYGELLA